MNVKISKCDNSTKMESLFKKNTMSPSKFKHKSLKIKSSTDSFNQIDPLYYLDHQVSDKNVIIDVVHCEND